MSIQEYSFDPKKKLIESKEEGKSWGELTQELNEIKRSENKMLDSIEMICPDGKTTKALSSEVIIRPPKGQQLVVSTKTNKTEFFINKNSYDTYTRRGNKIVIYQLTGSSVILTFRQRKLEDIEKTPDGKKDKKGGPNYGIQGNEMKGSK